MAAESRSLVLFAAAVVAVVVVVAVSVVVAFCQQNFNDCHRILFDVELVKPTHWLFIKLNALDECLRERGRKIPDHTYSRPFLAPVACIMWEAII